MKSERQAEMLRLVEESNVMGVAEMAAKLGVSPMTIRRDLDELAKSGLVRRQHGAVTRSLGRSYEPPFSKRAEENNAAKSAIGKLAAAQVSAGEAIGIDVGTTALFLAENLQATNVTIVTASLRVAMKVATSFALERDLRVVVLGGLLRNDELSLVGGIAEAALAQLRLDKCFIGVGGISLSDGATEFNLDDAQIKRRMIGVSRQVYVLADSKKFDVTAFAKVCELTTIGTVVTDSGVSDTDINGLEALGVEVLVAEV